MFTNYSALAGLKPQPVRLRRGFIPWPLRGQLLPTLRRHFIPMAHYPRSQTYDVIVVGAGHAGCEAALAAARMGSPTLLLTISIEAVGRMSCNPAIGGLAKGQLVREIDALGGEMAKVADATAIQFRMLNRSRGPAVHSPRCQSDRLLYAAEMRRRVELQPGLDLRQEMVEELIVEGRRVPSRSGGVARSSIAWTWSEHGQRKAVDRGTRRVLGVRTASGLEYRAGAVILTTGTFLRGLIHLGTLSYPGGRAGEFPAEKLPRQFKGLGIDTGRLKTGTPPRLNGTTLDFSKMEIQYGDPDPVPFSFSTKKLDRPELPCYITWTSPETHRIINDNLHRAPLFSGRIKGVGPRYCPSIEVKIVNFPDKLRHQLFIEPEGAGTSEVYVNGLATSIPPDVQLSVVRSIPGLEKAHITRFGYAIEYDFVPPTQTRANLESKQVGYLFLAGQINGTSGYEEAAAQGLMAGINAALKLRDDEPFILDRSEAYIGVLIDDLVTLGTEEPYRMFTSRAEYRLVLRQDNADRRLMHHGHRFGLISDEQFDELQEKERLIAETCDYIGRKFHGGASLAKVLRRPESSFADIEKIDDELRRRSLPKDVKQQVEIETKYRGYIERQNRDVENFRRFESRRIPEDIDYAAVGHISREGREKLARVRPVNLGQAGRISGVSPADVSVLIVYLESLSHNAGR